MRRMIISFFGSIVSQSHAARSPSICARARSQLPSVRERRRRRPSPTALTVGRLRPRRRCRPGRHATTTRDGTLGTLYRHSTRTVGQLGDDSPWPTLGCLLSLPVASRQAATKSGTASAWTAGRTGGVRQRHARPPPPCRAPALRQRHPRERDVGRPVVVEVAVEHPARRADRPRGHQRARHVRPYLRHRR